MLEWIQTSFRKAVGRMRIPALSGSFVLSEPNQWISVACWSET